MKNITVSVDEGTYHRARIRAAEQRTSVSAMVRSMLREAAAEETEFEKRRRWENECIAKLREKGRRFSGADRVPREAIHDRDAVR